MSTIGARDVQLATADRTTSDGFAGSSAMVRLERVDKTYESRRGAVQAARDISLEVADRELVSIVGPSGGGKTTILKLVAGLLRPTAGTIWVDGNRVEADPPQGIGMVFQAPVLLPWRSALENVTLPARILRLDMGAARRRARELLEQVGLTGFNDRRVYELSGGMQQRISLCRALLHRPRLLLMDEPFGAVDELTRESLNDQLLALWQADAKTVVFVTHSIEEAVYLSDRVVVLSPRPSTILGIETIDLPRPRDGSLRLEPEFAAHVRSIRASLGLAA
ncbi:MAG: ATP-binding cassette domain-containing protein [Solirubrobacterales bacterium]|nr:ATP-binding cassette domain-containing protein [Solirubrobacterales bacterium]